MMRAPRRLNPARRFPYLTRTARRVCSWRNLLPDYGGRSIAQMERRLAMWVAFDGTEFHGWQTQPGQRTVQDLLEQAARRVLRHPVALCGSGRTDAGVHASAHVCHFDTTRALPVARLRHALGSRLPHDVSIIALREVHRAFHATRSAISKLYRYRIHNALRRPVERAQQRYVYHYWHGLDESRMQDAAGHFVGEMDFTAMAATKGDRESMVRRVIRCEVERHLDEIRIDVEGTGFLYRQVRNMVGTLIEIGCGRWEADRVPLILKSKDRATAGPTAPACGLSLRWVRYPPSLLTPQAEEGVSPDLDAATGTIGG